MSDIPYRPRIKIGSLRQTAKKVMVTKASGSRVGDEKLKKFLKEEKGLRRMAYGDTAATVESWRGRHYVKDIKEKVKGSEEFRQTLYGRKTTAAQEFRDTVREEVRQDEATHPKGPSADELERQKRLDTARQHLRQYEQSKQVEQEMGKPMSGGPAGEVGAGRTSPAPAAPFKSVSLPGGGAAAAGRAGGAAGAATGVFVVSGRTKGTDNEITLPPIFGLRGRTLRQDSQNNSVFTHVLNAPPELASVIGRDLTILVPAGARCWKERHAISCTEIFAGDIIDARGTIADRIYTAQEVYVNSADLPHFVTHLDKAELKDDLPSEPPSELVIG